MSDLNIDDMVETGRTALRAGRWEAARAAFSAVTQVHEMPEALAGMGDALFWLGESRESIHHRERAYAAYRRAGNVFGAAESGLWLCMMYSSALGNIPAARGWLARTERLLGDAEAGPFEGWMGLCRTAFSDDLSFCRQVLEQTLEIAREMGDTDLELCALSELGITLVKLGDVESGLRHLDEAMAATLGGEQKSFDTVVFTSCGMLTVCDLLGDLSRASQWCRAIDELTRTYGGPYLYANCRTVYGRILVMKGLWAEAEHELHEAIRATKDVYPAMYSRSLVSLADLRLRQGRFEEAQALLVGIENPLETALVEAALAIHRLEPRVSTALIERWLRSRDERHSGTMHSGGELTVHTAAALGLLVASCLAAGDPAAAMAAAGQLVELALVDKWGIALAHSAFAQGGIKHHSGDTDLARRCFEEAIERFAQLELPLETARARFRMAQTIQSSWPEAAVVEAQSALSVFDRLGAAADADMTAALLRSWGVAGRTGPRDTGLLTKREQEVLELVAAGLSNPEIAQRLYISRKTVAHHISNLFSKLGLRNRTEAATYLSHNRAAR